MLLKFKEKKDFKKVYHLLNDLFFGDFLKKMIVKDPGGNGKRKRG